MRVLLCAMTGMGNAALTSLRSAGIDVVAVITDPVDGPGFPHYPCEDLVSLCRRCRVPIWSGFDFKQSSSLARIQQESPDVLVVATSKKIIPPSVVEFLQGRAINCHPSLLPHHRGPTPVAWTIQHGDRETGLTFIQPTPQIDAGPIWSQHRITVESDETAGSLRCRLDQQELPKRLPDVVASVVSGSVKPQPQTGTATQEPRIDPLIWGEESLPPNLDQCLRDYRARVPHPGVFLRDANRLSRIGELHILDRAAPHDLSRPSIMISQRRFEIFLSDGTITGNLTSDEPQLTPSR